MSIVSAIAAVVNLLLMLYMIVLLMRLVLEWMPILNREWRPRGAVLVGAEVVYTITDPPIRFFRRILPPLRIGPVALDLAFMFTMLSVFVLMSIVRIFLR